VPKTATKFAQAVIGLNLGVSFSFNIFFVLKGILLPLAGYLIMVLVMGLLSGYLLIKMSDIEPLTALFCCMPGGASEMIGLADEFEEADPKLVAVYHSFRVVLLITLMSFLIPWSSYMLNGTQQVFNAARQSILTNMNIGTVITLLFISAICFIIGLRIKIPASTPFVSLFIGILLNALLFHIPRSPQLFTSIGQLVL
jgi:membrane AbrB-like protein